MLKDLLQSVKDWANNIFVKLAGDTVTGAIKFKNDNLDRDGEAPSAIVYGQTMPQLVDKDGESIGYMQPSIDANGISRVQITAVSENNDTLSYASLIVLRDRNSSVLGEVWTNCWMSVNTRLSMRANSDNYAAINFHGLNRSSDVIRLYGAPNAAGDGMVINTGGLFIAGAGEAPANLYSALGADPGTETAYIASDNAIYFCTNGDTIANRSDTYMSNGVLNMRAPYSRAAALGTSANNGATASTLNAGLYLLDKNGQWAGRLYSEFNGTAGQVYTWVAARNEKTDGTFVMNYLGVGVAKNGTLNYSVSSPTNFRSAIAAANKPTQLYNNASGSNGTITLSASAANYNHMRIYYRNASGQSSHVNQYNTTDVFSPNGKYVNLAIVGPDNTSDLISMNTRLALISGTTINNARSASGNISSSGAAAGAYNEVYIVRVEAWND